MPQRLQSTSVCLRDCIGIDHSTWDEIWYRAILKTLGILFASFFASMTEHEG